MNTVIGNNTGKNLDIVKAHKPKKVYAIIFLNLKIKQTKAITAKVPNKNNVGFPNT